MNNDLAAPPLFDITQTKGMIAVLNRAGRLLQANNAFLQFLNFPADKILNATLACLTAPEEQEKANALSNEALSGTPVYGHLAMYTAAGERKIVNITTAPLLHHGSIWGAYCFFKDVTETVVKNKKVHDSEQRLYAIFNTALESVKIYAPDGTLLDINPAGLSLLAVGNKADLAGKSFLPFIYEEDKAAFKQLHQQVCRGQSGTLQYRIHNLLGQLLWVESNTVPLKDKYGHIYATLSVTRDISKKKKAEINLHLSEQKFRSLVQNGSDLIFVIDEAGYVQYVSPTVKEIAGYEPEQLLGKQAFSFLHAEDLDDINNELQKVKTNTNTGTATTHRFLNSSGQWIWLESKGANLLHDSNVRGMVINSRDVTDRIRLQQKLDQELANRQKKITAAVIAAQESERSQLGQELHDNVNQVLTTVKLYNEMLAGDIGHREEILKKSTHYLQICIDEIRSISKRLSAPTLGKISLTDSVHELVDSINITNKLSIHYTFKGFEGAAVSQEVHLTIYRIIQEQLNNIIKHAQAQNVFIEISNTPQHLLLVITDDGKGFDSRQKRRGIGITNMITRAENSNGRLRIQTAPGKGCVVTVTLPPLSICNN